VLGLLVVLTLAGWLLLDRIVRRTIETQTTASTRLETRLDSAHLSLLGGRLKLRGLGIGSPKGFEGEFFRLKGAKVEVAYSQLRRQPIHIAKVILEGPYLLVEQKSGQLNVQAAMAGMPQGDSDLRLIIDSLEIRETTLVVRPGLPVLKAEYTITLPTLTLKNIGSGAGAANGAALKEVLSQIMVAVLDEARRTGKLPIPLNLPSLGSTLSSFLPPQLEATGKRLQGITKRPGELLEQATGK